jgi:nucleotide-binding universal stress UspA family protein
MSFKTILMHVAPGEGDHPRVRLAARMARAFGAELHGIGAEAFLPNSDRRLTHLDGHKVIQERERLEAEIARTEALFRAVAAEAGVACGWRSALDDPDDIILQQAGGADLIVAAKPRGRQDPRRFAETADLILGAGGPVLVVPPGAEAVAPTRVLIGWKQTREAEHAIWDALPFLHKAEAVALVAIRPALEADAANGELGDVAGRLQRHGLTVDRAVHAPSDLSTGDRLLELAEGFGAGLIVVGGYGRSRLTQRILGGVTSDLLDRAVRPVLFSH